jgi:hypothetical protein
MYRQKKTTCPRAGFYTNKTDGQLIYGPIEADVIDYNGKIAVNIGVQDYGENLFFVEHLLPEGTKKGDIVYVYRELVS